MTIEELPPVPVVAEEDSKDQQKTLKVQNAFFFKTQTYLCCHLNVSAALDLVIDHPDHDIIFVLYI